MLLSTRAPCDALHGNTPRSPIHVELAIRLAIKHLNAPKTSRAATVISNSVRDHDLRRHRDRERFADGLRHDAQHTVERSRPCPRRAGVTTAVASRVHGLTAPQFLYILTANRTSAYGCRGGPAGRTPATG